MTKGTYLLSPTVPASARHAGEPEDFTVGIGGNDVQMPAGGVARYVTIYEIDSPDVRQRGMGRAGGKGVGRPRSALEPRPCRPEVIG